MVLPNNWTGSRDPTELFLCKIITSDLPAWIEWTCLSCTTSEQEPQEPFYSPLSDIIWHGTKDFSYLIGASFIDPKIGWCAWTNQSSSQGPLGIKLSLTSTKHIEMWLVQIPTWGQKRKRWKMLLRPRAILTIQGFLSLREASEQGFCSCRHSYDTKY